MNFRYRPDLLFTLFFAFSAVLIIYCLIKLCCCNYREGSVLRYYDDRMNNRTPLVSPNSGSFVHSKNTSQAYTPMKNSPADQNLPSYQEVMKNNVQSKPILYNPYYSSNV